MKILFHGPALSSTRPPVSLPYTTGIISGKYVETIDKLRPYFNLTGNTGNIIHAEAPMNFLSYDVKSSALTDLHRLYQQYEDSEKFSDDISGKYDCIVLSLANLIRPDFNTNLYEILNSLTIPFYVFGVGLQNDVKLSSLRPNTRNLLKVLNTKAKLFGCRGKRTETWLHENGFDNAKALGCPSLYAFPNQIFKPKTFKIENIKRALISGHLSEKYISGKGDTKTVERLNAVIKLSGCFPSASYVYQDEPFSYSELGDVKGIWYPEKSQLDTEFMNSYLSVKVDKNFSFDKHYFFFSSDTWRQVASEHDIYIGDRLHAGIAAFQAGIPSIILYGDTRVKELAEYYNLPSMSVYDVNSEKFEDKLAELGSKDVLEKFYKTYEIKVKAFIENVRSSGLKLKASYDLLDNKVTEGHQNKNWKNLRREDVSKQLAEKYESTSLKILHANILEKECGREISWGYIENIKEQEDGDINYLWYLFKVLKVVEYNIEKDIDCLKLKSLPRIKDKNSQLMLNDAISFDRDCIYFNLETIKFFVENNFNECFDQCISWLFRYNYDCTDYLKIKIYSGFGTRKRVTQLLNVLLKRNRLDEVSEVLNRFGNFLSDDAKSKFLNRLNK